MNKQKAISKILIFEGLDKTGKSTLRKELLSVIPHQMTIDRLVMSQLVYDKFYNRYDNTRFIKNVIDILKPISIVIFVKCSYDKYIERCKNTNHEILSKSDFEYQLDLFEHTLFQLNYNTIIIDTSKDTIEESCSKLLSELNTLDAYTEVDK
jgi:thymidylate kinase